MGRFLIVYGTEQGQTKKIAEFIHTELHDLGHASDVFSSKKVSPFLNPLHYDGIIVGASVHASGYPRSLVHWVRIHADALYQKPSAFFSVCLGILQKEEKVQQAEREIVEKFFSAIHWRAPYWTIFAGALSYSKYNWALKRVMHRISKKAGFDTDMKHDYEYTDWSAVRIFTQDFARLVHSSNIQKTKTELDLTRVFS